MTRYSISRSTISATDPSELVSSLEDQYRELLDLRERVKMAEAAARHVGPRAKLEACPRRVARVVSRKPIARRSEAFTKPQLYAMLADAVRNTQ
jgi:hypothetical protein